MKIAIDISQIVYGTGVSSYTENLVESLLKIDHKNEYILFGSSARHYKKLVDFKNKLRNHTNVQFKFLPLPISALEFVWNRTNFFPIEKFIGDVDIFHSSDWIQPPVKSKKTKLVTTVHDMIPYLFPNSAHPKIIAVQKRRLEKVKNKVGAIITNSKTTKEDLVKFLQIPENKVFPIYLAASDEFKPQDDEKVNLILEKFNIKKPYILCVATQEPRKNIQKIIDVFKNFEEARPNVKLVLAGKYGWGKEFVPEANVNWTKFIPKDELIALYCGCRAFVYPSLYEGFGLPIIEAMACGAPVICSNNSSMLEVAKEAAILVDPRSEKQIEHAIELVLDLDLENYQKLVRASLNRARGYSWTKTARETLKVYEDLTKDQI